jgi:general secretion pathway protein D
VPDGGSIVIAGLGVNINMKGRNGIPLLSDVPILGKFFSNDTSQSEKRNYMILVNARMILLDEEEAKLDR